MSKSRKVISLANFISKTQLLPVTIAETCLEQRQGSIRLTTEQQNWFVAHVQTRMRQLYSRNPQVRRRLVAGGNAGRDWAYTMVNHWLTAYLQNTEHYKARHLAHDKAIFADATHVG